MTRMGWICGNEGGSQGNAGARIGYEMHELHEWISSEMKAPAALGLGSRRKREIREIRLKSKALMRIQGHELRVVARIRTNCTNYTKGISFRNERKWLSQ